jgi:hypothetical protein
MSRSVGGSVTHMTMTSRSRSAGTFVVVVELSKDLAKLCLPYAIGRG